MDSPVPSDTSVRCALCERLTPRANLDHIDVPRGTVPVCFGCIGELNDIADAHNDAAREHMEACALPCEDAWMLTAGAA